MNIGYKGNFSFYDSLFRPNEKCDSKYDSNKLILLNKIEPNPFSGKKNYNICGSTNDEDGNLTDAFCPGSQCCAAITQKTGICGGNHNFKDDDFCTEDITEQDIIPKSECAPKLIHYGKFKSGHSVLEKYDNLYKPEDSDDKHSADITGFCGSDGVNDIFCERAQCCGEYYTENGKHRGKCGGNNLEQDDTYCTNLIMTPTPSVLQEEELIFDKQDLELTRITKITKPPLLPGKGTCVNKTNPNKTPWIDYYLADSTCDLFEANKDWCEKYGKNNSIIFKDTMDWPGSSFRQFLKAKNKGYDPITHNDFIDDNKLEDYPEFKYEIANDMCCACGGGCIIEKEGDCEQYLGDSFDWKWTTPP
jgi:hypothetical protein